MWKTQKPKDFDSSWVMQPGELTGMMNFVQAKDICLFEKKSTSPLPRFISRPIFSSFWEGMANQTAPCIAVPQCLYSRMAVYGHRG